MSIRMVPSSSNFILTPPYNSNVSLMARLYQQFLLENMVMIALMDQMNETYRIKDG